MKISLIQIGKTNEDYLKEGIMEYHNRLKKYIGFEVITVPDLKNARNLSINEIKQREGHQIIRYCNPMKHIILLDKGGNSMSSPELADFLGKKINIGKDLVMIIGGAYGFSDEVYKGVDDLISLSRLTFSHQIVRLILAEQLYRAMTILRREPYHHE